MIHNTTLKSKQVQSRFKTELHRTVSAGILCIFLCIFSVAALPLHENLLYQHSFFAGKHWQRCSDTLDYNLSSGFTSLTPVKTSVAGNDTGNVILFSTASNKLYLMHALLEPPPTYTSNNKLTTDTPVESPVGTAASVFGVFPYTSANIDIIFLAVAAGAGKIAVHQMTSSTFTVFKTDTLTVALPGSSSITKLYGGPALAKGGQSSIWAVGSQGLIRFFSFDGSVWSAESVLDIDPAETVTALSLAAVGTQSGKIYEDQAGSFVLSGQPHTGPINHITAEGAVSNGGVVIRKKGAQWTKFTAGSTNYTFFNFIARTDGFGVELLDDSWNFSKHTLEDTPTSYTILPQEVADYINGSTYIFDSIGPDTITINLTDPDGNYLVPSITLNDNSSITDTLKHMHPDTSSVPGFTDLADTTMKLILTRSSIAFSTHARKAAFNAITQKYYWVYSLFETSNSWYEGNTISILLPGQTLSIQNGMGTTTSYPDKNKHSQKPLLVSCNNRGIIFNVSHSRVRSIRIFNPAGREIASAQNFGDRRIILIPLQIPSGIFFVEYGFADGSCKREVLPVLK